MATRKQRTAPRGGNRDPLAAGTGSPSAAVPSPFPPIAEYAFLSDCHTGALVAPDGAVDWLCVPRFDSASVFGSLLDREAGAFRFGPFGINVPSSRVYESGTNVVMTTWMTPSGWVEVRDALTMGTADLQRDLGGAIMQSIFGALLTAGFATAMGAAITASPDSSDITSSVQSELTKSFSSAADTAQRYPQYSSQITAAAKSSFLDGANWAYAAGILAVLGGAALVFFMFPKKDQELEMLASYHDADATPGGART